METSPKKLLLRNSVTFRIVIISIIAFLLLIPATMVQYIIDERETTSTNAIAEVSAQWANDQTITGPIVSIPYIAFEANEQNRTVSVQHNAHFLPELLRIRSEIVPELRHRGIYDIVVYTSQLEIEGYFKRPTMEKWTSSPERIVWQKAALNLGLSDLRGIEDELRLNWNGAPYEFAPGLTHTDLVESGISVALPQTALTADSIPFRCTIHLRGSGSLSFSPVGKTTQVWAKSSWASPSFAGSFLPDSSSVSPKGFAANWKVLHLNRNFPQTWTDSEYKTEGANFNIKLYVPADQYQKSSRTAKYAFMLIALTFVLFFFVEVFNKRNVHPLQYLLVGLVLIIFFTLLVSLSEQIGFDWAYLVSATAVVVLIGVYVRSVLGTLKLTLITAAILSLLYGFIYVTLQLEDFALLLGSVGLFGILATIMILTRKIDWYAISEQNQA